MKKIVILVVVVIALAGGYLLVKGTSSATPVGTSGGSPMITPDVSPADTSGTTSSAPAVSSPATSPASQVQASYSLADIAPHKKASDCWTAVNGKVYNVTAFIPSHPGGIAIVQACGKDGSSLFNKEREHVKQGAQGTLDNYYIGNLKS